MPYYLLPTDELPLGEDEVLGRLRHKGQQNNLVSGSNIEQTSNTYNSNACNEAIMKLAMGCRLTDVGMDNAKFRL